jgi:hypothetical protein
MKIINNEKDVLKLCREYSVQNCHIYPDLNCGDNMNRTFPIIDKKSVFYKNCKRNRKVGAKICQVCPFRKGIESQEK